MTDKIIEKIEDEMMELLVTINQTDSGSDEYENAMKVLAQLQKLLNDNRNHQLEMCKNNREDEKVESEFNVKMNSLEYDRDIRQEQLDIERLKLDASVNTSDADRKVGKIGLATKTVLEGAAIVAPLVFYGVWMNRGLEFEKEGTFTSNVFKGLINRFKV